MIKGKKIISILMALVIASSFSACKSKSATVSNDSGKPDTSKFVTINYVMLGNKPTNGQDKKVEDKWNAILKKKVNANLHLQWVEWADWYTKYNLLLASGQPLDLITTASDWLDLWPNAQKGAFKNLDELLPKYAPKTFADVSKENWEQCKYNDKIVTMPEDKYTQWVNHGFMYRGDWAKEFGIATPIKDWTTYGKYLQGVKDKKPGVIPWDFVGGTYSSASGWFISKTQGINIDAVPTACGSSLYYGKSSNDPFTVISPFMEETFMDYAKTMKQWGDAGYWREDVLNFKGDDWVEFKGAKNGTRQNQTNEFITKNYEMKIAQPTSDEQFFPWAVESGNLTSMPITHGATSIGQTSKNPERALMVYDLIRNDPELYKLMNYGIEGTHYIMKDGKKDLPVGFNYDKDNFYSDFWGGRNDKLEIPSATLYPQYKELYAQYDKIKHVYPYGQFVFNKGPVDSEIAALTEVSSKLLPAISAGKAGEPVKAVNDYRAQLKKAGFDKVLTEIQKQMDDYKKLVGSK